MRGGWRAEIGQAAPAVAARRASALVYPFLDEVLGAREMQSQAERVVDEARDAPNRIRPHRDRYSGRM